MDRRACPASFWACRSRSPSACLLRNAARAQDKRLLSKSQAHHNAQREAFHASAAHGERNEIARTWATKAPLGDQSAREKQCRNIARRVPTLQADRQRAHHKRVLDTLSLADFCPRQPYPRPTLRPALEPRRIRKASTATCNAQATTARTDPRAPICLSMNHCNNVKTATAAAP